MRVTLNGKRWLLQWIDHKLPVKEGKTTVLNGVDLGVTEAPDVPNKRILVRKGLREEKELEILIHEFLHACFWQIDEDEIYTSAKDIARELLRIGWRKECSDSSS